MASSRDWLAIDAGGMCTGYGGRCQWTYRSGLVADLEIGDTRCRPIQPRKSSCLNQPTSQLKAVFISSTLLKFPSQLFEILLKLNCRIPSADEHHYSHRTIMDRSLTLRELRSSRCFKTCRFFPKQIA